MKLSTIDDVLIDLIIKSQQSLESLYIQAYDNNDRAVIINNMKSILGTVRDTYTDYVDVVVPYKYIEGYITQDTERQKKIKELIKGLEEFVDINEGKQKSVEAIQYLGQVHVETVKNLISDAITTYNVSIDSVEKSITSNISRSLVQKIQLNIAEANLSGQAFIDLKQRIIKELREGGLTYFRGPSGKKLQLTDYTDMVIRTTQNNAYRQSNINSGIEAGATKRQRIERIDKRTCSYCRSQHEKIKNTENLDEWIRHPRCRGTLIPIFG